MKNLKRTIKAALKFYGPLPVSLLQEKLIMRGFNLSCKEITSICLETKGIHPALGYNEAAFKI